MYDIVTIPHLSFTPKELHIWDTAGMEANRHGLLTQYYRGADGVIFVYDITDPQTFKNVAEVWLREQRLYLPSDKAVLALVGNKLDQEPARKVSSAEGQALADDHKMLFVELSAMEESGLVKVQDLLKRLAHDMMFGQTFDPGASPSKSNNISLGWELLDAPTEPVPREAFEQQEAMASRRRKGCQLGP